MFKVLSDSLALSPGLFGTHDRQTERFFSGGDKHSLLPLLNPAKNTNCEIGYILVKILHWNGRKAMLRVNNCG